jgi:hypothetical protein
MRVDYFTIATSSTDGALCMRADTLDSLKEKIQNFYISRFGGQVFHIYRSHGTEVEKIGTITRPRAELQWRGWNESST